MIKELLKTKIDEILYSEKMQLKPQMYFLKPKSRHKFSISSGQT